MRTTVELPSTLFRRAKARAASRGESLKTLLTRAVAAEVGRDDDRSPAPRRMRLPLFGDTGAPSVDLHASDLARAMADEDLARVRRRRRRR